MLGRTRGAEDGDDRGFTLVELLVVIVIIGILASIAVPTFLHQREKAWARAAQSDLRNAVLLVQEYYSEHGTYAGAQELDFRESGSVQEVRLQIATDTEFCLYARSSTLHGDFGQEDSSVWSFLDNGYGGGRPTSQPCPEMS